MACACAVTHKHSPSLTQQHAPARTCTGMHPIMYSCVFFMLSTHLEVHTSCHHVFAPWPRHHAGDLSLVSSKGLRAYGLRAEPTSSEKTICKEDAHLTMHAVVACLVGSGDRPVHRHVCMHTHRHAPTFVFMLPVSRSKMTTVPALELLPVHTHRFRPTTHSVCRGSENWDDGMKTSTLRVKSSAAG